MGFDWNVIGDNLHRWGDQIGQKLFGTPADPGAFGTGQYQAQRYTPQGVTLATGPADAARSQQQQLVDRYMQVLAGQTPSVAEQQLHAGTDRALSGALSYASTARGPGAAAAQRTAAYAQGNIAQQGAADAATLRAQEQEQARASLGQLLSGVRGQDQSQAGAQAGFDQQLQQLLQSGALGFGALDAQSYASSAGNRQNFIGALLKALGVGGAAAGAGG